MKSIFEQMADDRDSMAPDDGFNLVSIDDLSFPPEVNVQEHFDTEDEAVAAMNAWDGSAVVYNSRGEAVASKSDDT